jgi:iron complex outermembrane receptor protein
MKNKQKKCILLFLSVFMFCAASYAQGTVQGQVVDVSGESVIGANVVVRGTNIGTATDLDGNYSLSNVALNSVLEFSYIGYQTQVVTYTGQATVNVTLREDAQLLDELVVIGYGTTKKADLTGSVTAIKPDEISKGITTSAQDMMVGKIAGVSVITKDGTPGGGAQIRIRGGSSLNASNDPLIVIDGLAMDNDGVKGMSNGLSMVNPNDIETFTILKDASATAIYGSRASNGVIIITTKKGKSGTAPSLSYNGNTSVGKIRSMLKVMDADSYRSYINDLYGDELPYELGTDNTDWQKEIYRTAFSHDHNVTVTGGLKNMPYRVSVGYTDQQGILKTSDFQRTTASVSLSPSFFKDELKFNVNAKGMYAQSQFADAGAVGAAVGFDPTRPVHATTPNNEFGGYYQWSTGAASLNDPDWLLTNNANAPQNPVALLNQKDDSATAKDFVGNIEADYKLNFFPDIHVHGNLGYDYSTGLQKTITSPYSFSNNYYGWDGQSKQDKYNFSGNAYLQYLKTFDVHSLNIMAGAEEQHFHRTWRDWGSRTNHLSGDPKVDGSDISHGRHSTLVSYFGRLNYTLLDRYLITATIRQDGTSRFSPDDRWGTFPSAAFAWKVKEESFLRDVNVLSDLKLRLGWGITGQQNINDQDFPYLPQYIDNIGEYAYYQFGDGVVHTSSPSAYNSKLKWEETTTYNAGLDFGFLSNRITGAIDLYYRKTDDLLNTVKIAAMSNFNTMLLSNIGSLENKGVEFSIDFKPVVTKDFMWDVIYNVTYNNNEITKLTAANSADYYVGTGGISRGTGSTIQAHKVGYPASSFYVYQQVYDANGKPIENLFVDRNGDGIINDADRYIYKKPTADVLMGLTSKMLYKDWDFSFALRASLNNYVYNDVLANSANVSASGMYTLGFYNNRPVDAINLGFQGLGSYYMSDYFVQNASFLRCDNITLGYSFQELLKSANYKGFGGRVYATVQNPFVITKYSGLDPEIDDGIDNNIYPRPMTFLVGLSLQF